MTTVRTLRGDFDWPLKNELFSRYHFIHDKDINECRLFRQEGENDARLASSPACWSLLSRHFNRCLIFFYDAKNPIYRDRQKCFQNREKGPFVGKLKLSRHSIMCNFWYIVYKKAHLLTGTYNV